MMSYPDCEACPCDVPDLETDEIQGGIFGGGGNQSTKIGKYTVNSRTSGSLLADVNSNDFYSNAVNFNNCNFDGSGDQEHQGGYTNPAPVGPTYFCFMDPQLYSGSEQKKNQKYQADSFGIRYGIAGYPTAPEIGMPIVADLTDGKYIQQRDVPYSQSLNLANLKARYFDSQAPNIIQTTINGSAPIFDNMLILLVDQGTASQLTSGSIVTFNDPTNIVDINISGLTNQNQFGTNSITGTSTTALTQTNITFANPVNGNPQTVSVALSGSNSEKQYEFKTGMEYFQVITGMTTYQADLLAFGTPISQNPNPINQLNNSSLLRKYFLNKRQEIKYRDSNNNLTNKN